MVFTSHAQAKLKTYNLTEEDIEASINYIHIKINDLELNSTVSIVNINDDLFAVVYNDNGGVITVYRTDKKTVDNRIKVGRWICL